jgi:glycosyltransferase involved in cell wall biosynthesis
MIKPMLKVLVLTYMFPDTSNTQLGIFIKREVEALSACCQLKVISPRPWIFRKYLTSEIDTYYPNYFPLPGRFFNPIKGWWFYVFTKSLISRIKNTFDFDIIHAHRVYPEGFAAILLGKLFRKPVVITVRGSDINVLPKQFMLNRLIRFALKNAAIIIAVSKELKEKVSSLGVVEGKIKIMPKGVDLEAFKPRDKNQLRKSLGLPQDKKIVLYVGNLVPVKNPFAIIEAVSCMPQEEQKKYLFVFIGQGELKQLIERKIRRLNMDSIFLLTGAMQPVQIPSWMNTADILVLPSISEGMPNVLYEAMACGLAVIASDVGGITDVITDGKNGLLFSSRDFKTLSSDIIKLANDESLRKELGRNARLYLENARLTWKTNATLVESFYKTALT